MKITRHPFFPLYLAIVGVIGLAAANGIAVAATPPADITVMPCSAWADNADPVIPPNTLTDVCVDENGTLHTAPTATDNTTTLNP